VRKQVALGIGSLASAALIAGCDGSPHAAQGAVATTEPSTSTTTVPPSATTAPGSALPRVIADCTVPRPQAQQSQVEPTSISLACADNGVGVEKLVWTSWTENNDFGTGEVWENKCTPNCANGTIETYSATMSLLGVETTTGGRLSHLTVAYQGIGRNGRTSEQFSLPLPPE
jgi:hypothetical protein